MGGSRMTVQELIDELMEVEDKNKEVILDYIDQTVLDVVETVDKVVLYDY